MRGYTVCGIEGRSYEHVRELAERGLAQFEATDNEHALLHVWWAIKNIAELELRNRDAAVAASRALEIARRLGIAHIEHDLVQGIATLMVFNDTPAEQALRFIEENQPVFAVRQIVGLQKALLHAMLGRADEGRTDLEHTVHVIRERGLAFRAWDTRWYFETLLGNHGAAYAAILADLPTAESLGRAYYSTAVAFLSPTRCCTSDDTRKRNGGLKRLRRASLRTT